MKDQQIRDAILLGALQAVAFDGWSERALGDGARAAGHAPEMAALAFPDGIPELLAYFSAWADRRMLAGADDGHLAALPAHDRVAALVRARLEALAPHREALRRALAQLALPVNLPLAARLAFRTLDDIWYAAGDRSTDWNFYTKRGLLAPVLLATTLYWLDDTSDGCADTRAFLDRRIAGVLKIPTYQEGLRNAFGRLPSPLRLVRRMWAR